MENKPDGKDNPNGGIVKTRLEYFSKVTRGNPFVIRAMLGGIERSLPNINGNMKRKANMQLDYACLRVLEEEFTQRPGTEEWYKLLNEAISYEKAYEEAHKI